MISATRAQTRKSAPITNTAVRVPLPALPMPMVSSDGAVLLVHQPCVVGLGPRLRQVLRVLRLARLLPFASHGREGSGAGRGQPGVTATAAGESPHPA